MTGWPLDSLIALVIANGLAAVMALWIHSRLRDGETVSPSALREGRVVCRECGADNEVGFRFCRRCIAELPGPALYSHDSGHSRSSNSL